MPKRKFAWAEMAPGALVSALVLLAFWLQWGESLELKLYDVRAGLRAASKPAESMVLVVIDERSRAELGAWPWPRSHIADMVEQLSAAGAKVIGLDVFYDDPEINPALQEVRGLKQALARSGAAKPLAQVLEESEKRLDNDARLVRSLAQAQNVVLPMYFQEGQAIGKSDKPVPEAVEKNFIAGLKSAGTETSAVDFAPPYEAFANQAKAMGQANLTPSEDGVQRWAPLVVDYDGRLFPSFALQTLRAFYNQGTEYSYVGGRELGLGRARIPVDARGRMLLNWIGQPSKAFITVSFTDVRHKRLENMAMFRDKMVLVGATAAELSPTPVGDLAGVEIQATVMQNVLSNSYLVRPPWAPMAEIVLLLAVAVFVSVLAPQMSVGRSAGSAAVLLAVTFAGGAYAFVAQGYWLKIFYPMLMLVAGYGAVVAPRMLGKKKRRQFEKDETAETNMVLGLSFQGQGMLDMAFDKFRKCPLDDGMKELLYNLGLDFERKRQFNKAVSVYEHIHSVDKTYRDILRRMEKLRLAGEQVMLGAKPTSAAPVLAPGGELAKPTLGRYEVVRELGKGAMGTVYLGRDPKIQREVAIKTLRFADEFEPSEMAAIKARFFREAESAGRLVHPNIITIYDAGDDGEISYIAMELLQGSDLKEFTGRDKLLPVTEVLEIAAKVAEALDYAHQQGVVHRDIKPANIMRLKDGSIKVTDFGIARITSQSRTATGTVMGTPSYMAPEQVAGQKADGRADLFSLGITMYELLAGEKPFTGDSVATLMYRISSQPHASLLQARVDLPPGVEAIMDKALEKDPNMRYQRGSEMARDLHGLAARLAAAKAAGTDG